MDDPKTNGEMLRDALEAVAETGAYVGADPDDTLLDGNFDLERAAALFLETLDAIQPDA